MFKDIMIGQYFPTNSLLHRLDPRVKIIALMMIVGSVFFADSAAGYSFLAAVAAFLTALAKLPVKLVAKSIKPLWIIILFTAIVHIFSTAGETIFAVGIFKITAEGVQMAVKMSLRLVLLIVLASFLTFTTTPITLTDALERLMTPFKKVGLPAHELAMMMTIALRFIPTLLEETERIMKAQESRGADFNSGNILKRIKNMVPLLVPLFISAFRRADDLATAMEARCYRGGDNRTRLRVLAIAGRDYAAMAAAVMVVIVMAALRWLGI